MRARPGAVAQAPDQLPGPGEVFLDHVGWFVRAIEPAGAAFARLGFALTPFVVSRNADASGALGLAGTGNRCAMLRRGYLELIAAVDGVESELARQQRAAVARREGVHVVAFTVDNLGAAYTRLEAGDFDPLPPVLLRRPVETPEREATHARFTVVRVPPDKMPEGRIQILTQETPELVWQSRFLTGDNGVTGLTGVLFSVLDPDEAAARFGRFLGRRPLRGRIALDRGSLTFAAPAACRALLSAASSVEAPGVAAVSLMVEDPLETRAFLRGRGIPCETDGGCLVVGPESALGTALVLHPSDAPWPPETWA